MDKDYEVPEYKYGQWAEVRMIFQQRAILAVIDDNGRYLPNTPIPRPQTQLEVKE